MLHVIFIICASAKVTVARDDLLHVSCEREVRVCDKNNSFQTKGERILGIIITEYKRNGCVRVVNLAHSDMHRLLYYYNL